MAGETQLGKGIIEVEVDDRKVADQLQRVRAEVTAAMRDIAANIRETLAGAFRNLGSPARSSGGSGVGAGVVVGAQLANLAGATAASSRQTSEVLRNVRAEGARSATQAARTLREVANNQARTIGATLGDTGGLAGAIKTAMANVASGSAGRSSLSQLITDVGKLSNKEARKVLQAAETAGRSKAGSMKAMKSLLVKTSKDAEAKGFAENLKALIYGGGLDEKSIKRTISQTARLNNDQIRSVLRHLDEAIHKGTSGKPKDFLKKRLRDFLEGHPRRSDMGGTVTSPWSGRNTAKFVAKRDSDIEAMAQKAGVYSSPVPKGGAGSFAYMAGVISESVGGFFKGGGVAKVIEAAKKNAKGIAISATIGGGVGLFTGGLGTAITYAASSGLLFGLTKSISSGEGGAVGSLASRLTASFKTMQQAIGHNIVGLMTGAVAGGTAGAIYAGWPMAAAGAAVGGSLLGLVNSGLFPKSKLKTGSLPVAEMAPTSIPNAPKAIPVNLRVSEVDKLAKESIGGMARNLLKVGSRSLDLGRIFEGNLKPEEIATQIAAAKQMQTAALGNVVRRLGFNVAGVSGRDKMLSMFEMAISQASPKGSIAAGLIKSLRASASIGRSMKRAELSNLTKTFNTLGHEDMQSVLQSIGYFGAEGTKNKATMKSLFSNMVRAWNKGEAFSPGQFLENMKAKRGGDVASPMRRNPKIPLAKQFLENTAAEWLKDHGINVANLSDVTVKDRLTYEGKRVRGLNESYRPQGGSRNARIALDSKEAMAATLAHEALGHGGDFAAMDRLRRSHPVFDKLGLLMLAQRRSEGPKKRDALEIHELAAVAMQRYFGKDEGVLPEQAKAFINSNVLPLLRQLSTSPTGPVGGMDKATWDAIVKRRGRLIESFDKKGGDPSKIDALLASRDYNKPVTLPKLEDMVGPLPKKPDPYSFGYKPPKLMLSPVPPMHRPLPHPGGFGPPAIGSLAHGFIPPVYGPSGLRPAPIPRPQRPAPILVPLPLDVPPVYGPPRPRKVGPLPIPPDLPQRKVGSPVPPVYGPPRPPVAWPPLPPSTTHKLPSMGGGKGGGGRDMYNHFYFNNFYHNNFYGSRYASATFTNATFSGGNSASSSATANAGFWGRFGNMGGGLAAIGGRATSIIGGALSLPVRMLSGLSSVFSSSGTSMGNYFASAVRHTIVSELMRLPQQIGGLFIGGNAMMEQHQISMEVMTGSAGKAERMLGSLYQFAAVTPFQFGNVTAAATQLMAFGFQAREVMPLLQTIVDATSVSPEGMSTALNRVVLAFGHIRSRGVVGARELNQLAMAGIPAWEMLASHLGKNREEIFHMVQARQVGSSAALEALTAGIRARFGGRMLFEAGVNPEIKSDLDSMYASGKLTEAGMETLERRGVRSWSILSKSMGLDIDRTKLAVREGRITVDQFMSALDKSKTVGGFNWDGGIAQMQNLTFRGLMSNLTDYVQLAGMSLGKPFFESARSGLMAVVEWMGSNKGKGYLLSMADDAREAHKAMKQFFMGGWDILKPTLGPIIDIGRGIWGWIKPMLPFIAKVAILATAIAGIKMAVMGIAGLFSPLTIAVAAALSQFSGDQIGGFFQKIVFWVQANMETFAEWGRNVKEIFQGLGRAILLFITEVTGLKTLADWSRLAEGFKNSITGALDTISLYMQDAWGLGLNAIWLDFKIGGIEAIYWISRQIPALGRGILSLLGDSQAALGVPDALNTPRMLSRLTEMTPQQQEREEAQSRRRFDASSMGRAAQRFRDQRTGTIAQMEHLREQNRRAEEMSNLRGTVWENFNEMFGILAGTGRQRDKGQRGPQTNEFEGGGKSNIHVQSPEAMWKKIQEGLTGGQESQADRTAREQREAAAVQRDIQIENGRRMAEGIDRIANRPPGQMQLI